MPAISIVMPVYNGARFLEQALASVRAQTLADWELLVVDDGSRDGSAALVAAAARADGRVRLVRQTHQGPGPARNTGLAHLCGAGRYVIFLDADDCWYPDALRTLREALDAHPEAVAAYGLARRVRQDGAPLIASEQQALGAAFGRVRTGIVGGRVVPWPAAAPTTFAVLALWNCIETPGLVLLRRAAVEAVGALDTTVLSEDWDYWLRLSLLGALLPVPRLVLAKREHDANLSRDGRKMQRAEATIRCRLQRSPDLTAEQRTLARWAHVWSAYARLSLAKAAWRAGRRRDALLHVSRAALSGWHYLLLRFGPHRPPPYRMLRGVGAPAVPVAAQRQPTSAWRARGAPTRQTMRAFMPPPPRAGH